MSGTAQELFEAITRLPSPAARAAYVEARPELSSAAAVEELSAEIFRRNRTNAREALALGEAAVHLGERLGQAAARGRAHWAFGSTLHVLGRDAESVASLERAVEFLRESGLELELARALSGSVPPLMRLGAYEKAASAAASARAVFAARGDRRRLARLAVNVGNLLHRQDRFPEACAQYEEAVPVLEAEGDAEGAAAALSNLAVCLVSLDDFGRALSVHRHARELCVAHAMPMLVAQADYNIAYLYFLSGDYEAAIQGLREAEVACRRSGDAYHAALCSLDLAEVHLELNLLPEAASAAQDAASAFGALGSGYEAAKAQTFLALAWARQGRARPADALLQDAALAFGAEGNEAWSHQVAVYRAEVLAGADGEAADAHRGLDQAIAFFDEARLPRRAAAAQLASARLWLRRGRPSEARSACERARAALRALSAPALSLEAAVLLAQAADSEGRPDAAEALYRDARSLLATLRASTPSDRTRVSVLKGRELIFERLVALRHRRGGDGSAEEVLALMEEGRSRALADRLAWREAAASSGEASPAPAPALRPRQDLDWCYRRLERAELGSGPEALRVVQRLEARARQIEARISEIAGEGVERAPAAVHPRTTAEIRSSLPPDAGLVEYFAAGGDLLAAVLDRERTAVFPVAAVGEVAAVADQLRFQMGKWSLGRDHSESFAEVMLAATRAHLRSLYRLLVAPLRAALRGTSLVVVPHGPLNWLPFHAFLDGDDYLMDSFTVSYAPSGTVFAACQQRGPVREDRALVLGVADERAPLVAAELAAVAEALPSARVRVEAAVTLRGLRERGPGCRLLHVAGHGVFRSDNPAFSRIALGDGYLTVSDLHGLDLPVGLAVLSGCGTGLSVSSAGDEQLGLVTGFLRAGARSLVAALWDVEDARTAELMAAFYGRLPDRPPAEALAESMKALRAREPHPYLWASFVLVGGLSHPLRA